MMDESPLDPQVEIAIRGWAECKTDLEMELGLPAEQRASRIEQLISQRRAEIAAEQQAAEPDASDA